MVNDRVRLVFLNPDDMYYFGGVLTSDASRFLWLDFHNMDYDCVYYIYPHQSGIKICDYNDSECQRFTRKASGSGFLKKTLKVAEPDETDYVTVVSGMEFKTVVLPELRKRKVAIACSIQDFQSLISIKEVNSAFLDYIDNRKVNSNLFLLVTSETESILSEDSIRRYLAPSVVELMDGRNNNEDTSIRSELMNSDSCSCLFYDSIGRNDANNIILDIVMKDKERFETAEDVGQLTDYLTLISEESVPVDVNFELLYKLKNRRECHEYIESKRGWKLLCSNSRYVSYDNLYKIMDFDELFLRYQSVVTRKTVSDTFDSFRDSFSSLWNEWNSDFNNHIRYCVMVLCRELDSNKYKKDDYETRALIVTAISRFLEFSTTDDMSFRWKSFIADEFLSYFLECFKLAQKGIYGIQKRSGDTSLDKSEWEKKYRGNIFDIQERLELINVIENDLNNLIYIANAEDKDEFEDKLEKSIETYRYKYRKKAVIRRPNIELFDDSIFRIEEI